MSVKEKGFTLVELLIVIVIIAILAAITIVAYNGIQQRAANTQVVGVVKAYETALRNYRITGTGATQYPQQETGIGYAQCLGTGYTLGDKYCWKGSDGNYKESGAATLHSLLSEFMPTPPSITPQRYYKIGVHNNDRAGVVFFRGAYTDASPPKIGYILNGTGQDCAVGGAERKSSNWGGAGATYCELVLPFEK